MNKAILLIGLILISGCYPDLDENDLGEENLRLSEEMLHKVIEIEEITKKRLIRLRDTR